MEGGNELIKQSETRSVGEIIESRYKQGRTDRLVEYITGLKLDDAELINRLGTDQEIVRKKYGLPSKDFKFSNPSEYEKYLRELAKTNGVTVRPTSDCGKFFDENSIAGGVFLNKEKSIGVDIDKTDTSSFLKSLTTLEHETIHSLQDKFYPGMPIEGQEYEAYVANWNIDYLRENKEALEIVFSFGVGGSVGNWYKGESEEKGEEIIPKWDNPEYFLKNVDGINQKDIDNYKEKSLGKVGVDSVK